MDGFLWLSFVLAGCPLLIGVLGVLVYRDDCRARAAWCVAFDGEYHSMMGGRVPNWLAREFPTLRGSE